MSGPGGNSIGLAPTAALTSTTSSAAGSVPEHRLAKFGKVLSNRPVVDLEALRELSWNGVPQVWRCGGVEVWTYF